MEQALDRDGQANLARSIANKSLSGYSRGHTERLAGRCRNYRREILAVAWLHDVVEDTPVTLAALRERGIAPEICEAVDAITRRPEEKYMDYIDRVTENDWASLVKMEDIADHLDDAETLPESLRRRYEKAMARLEGDAP